MKDKDERYYKAYMEHNTISRRGLFRSLTGGGRKIKQEMEKPVVTRMVPRPPHAVEEILFQELCTGCGDCKENCKEYVIHIENNLAQLNLDYGYCSQCGECVIACQTGALSNQDPDIQLRPHFINSCQNRITGHCRLCEESCPHTAILVTSKKLPALDESLCDGCGRCKQACPFTAIQLNLANGETNALPN